MRLCLHYIFTESTIKPTWTLTFRATLPTSSGHTLQMQKKYWTRAPHSGQCILCLDNEEEKNLKAPLTNIMEQGKSYGSSFGIMCMSVKLNNILLLKRDISRINNIFPGKTKVFAFAGCFCCFSIPRASQLRSWLRIKDGCWFPLWVLLSPSLYTGYRPGCVFER